MRRRRGAIVLGCALAAALTSCALSPAPRGWLPRLGEVGSDPYGAWTEVSYWIHGHRLDVRGELVAVEHDSLFVLSDSTLVGVPIAARAYARVWVYEGGGTVATADYEHRPVITSSGRFEWLPKYARFPNGFPPGFDRGTLRPRARLR